MLENYQTFLILDTVKIADLVESAKRLMTPMTQSSRSLDHDSSEFNQQVIDNYVSIN